MEHQNPAAFLAADTPLPPLTELSADARRLLLITQRLQARFPWYLPEAIMIDARVALANPLGGEACDDRLAWARQVQEELMAWLMQHAIAASLPPV